MSQEIKPSSGKHWDVMDGLRGVAILMVVACHGFYTNPKGSKALIWLTDFISAGANGVQMFFVLSGFLISYPFLKAKQQDATNWYLPGYATRRLLKIFPPFLLCVLLLGFLYTWRDRNFDLFRLGLLWLVGVPHVFFIDRAFSFNGSFWSLWVELGFYVVLPFCFLALRKCGVWRSAVVIALGLFLVSLSSSFAGWPETPKGYYMIYFNGRFPNSLTNFGWGVLFAGIYLKTPRAAYAGKGKMGYVGAILLIATLVWQAFLKQAGLTSEWWAPASVTCAAGLATFFLLFFLFGGQPLATKILSSRGLKYIGVISYEWFLLHQPAILAWRHYVGDTHGNLLKYLFVVITPMIVTLIAAALIYEFMSAPIIAWGRARLTRKPATAADLQPS